MHRRGIDWGPRVGCAIATFSIDHAHELFFGHPENTRAAVSVYFFSSALFMVGSIFCYAHMLRAKLASDLMDLAYLAMVLNGIAWATYMGGHSLKTINIMIEALTYGTYARLLWIHDGDLDVGGWRDVVRRVSDWSKKIHFKEAKA